MTFDDARSARQAWVRLLLLDAAVDALLEDGVLDAAMLDALERQEGAARAIETGDAPMLRAYALIAQARVVAREAQGSTLEPEPAHASIFASTSRSVDLLDGGIVMLVTGLAELVRAELGAASVSVRRWHRASNELRVIANVGDLGPATERHPRCQVFALDEHPADARLLYHETPYMLAFEESGDDASRSPLRWFETRGHMAVAIVVGDEVWGELWAAVDTALARDEKPLERLELLAAEMGRALESAEHLLAGTPRPRLG